MDGENNGKPYEQMDDLGVKNFFLETPTYVPENLEISTINVWNHEDMDV